MAELFKEIIPSILQTKKVMVTPENERDYVPFVVNKALSFHKDCVLLANEMNLRPNTDGLLQYHFYLNTIRAYKRDYQQWVKKETVEDLEVLKEYYHFSNDKAKDALAILSHDQIDEIRKKLDKGGLNDKSKRTNRGDLTRTR
jgi:hypothetical protein